MRKVMGRTKGFVATVAALALSMSLVGCGDTESAADDTIKVGFMSDQSGDNALTCNVAAFELAISEINEAGGVLGKQLEPVIVDGQGDTQLYQSLAKELILEEECDVVFQDGTSANRESIRSIFEENESLLIYTTFYEGGVASRYTICTGTSPEQSILPLMEYVDENEVGESVYIIAADYNYGQISALWVEQYCDELGIDVVGIEYAPLGTSQFTSSISKIQESGADLVYTLIVGTAQKSFFDQWVSAGIEDTTLISTCNIAYSYEHISVEAPGLSGMLAAANFFDGTDDEDAIAFAEAVLEISPSEVYMNNESEAVYSSVYLWAEAVEMAGTAETEAVIDAFETDEVSFEAPSGTISIDGATHHATLTVSIVEVQDDHSLKVVEKISDIEPTYLLELGIDLRVEDPQAQYTPLD